MPNALDTTAAISRKIEVDRRVLVVQLLLLLWERSYSLVPTVKLVLQYSVNMQRGIRFKSVQNKRKWAQGWSNRLVTPSDAYTKLTRNPIR